MATYHQQSIQKTSKGGFIVTGSAQELGYVYLTDTTKSIIYIFNNPSYIDYQGNAYNHFGGSQIANNILAIGIERISGDNTSNILFFNVSDTSLSEIPQIRIFRGDASSKSAKESYTAGAVGLTLRSSGWLLAVANYNADRIDFYTCPKTDLNTIEKACDGFTFLKSWEPKKHDGGNNYQNINLFTQIKDGAESLWMVGMYSGGSPNYDDNADIFLIDLENNIHTKKNSKPKHFIRMNDGPRFYYGSGFYYNANDDKFEVYDCEANLSGSQADTCRCDKWD